MTSLEEYKERIRDSANEAAVMSSIEAEIDAWDWEKSIEETKRIASHLMFCGHRLAGIAGNMTRSRNKNDTK